MRSERLPWHRASSHGDGVLYYLQLYMLWQRQIFCVFWYLRLLNVSLKYIADGASLVL